MLLRMSPSSNLLRSNRWGLLLRCENKLWRKSSKPNRISRTVQLAVPLQRRIKLAEKQEISHRYLSTHNKSSITSRYLRHCMHHSVLPTSIDKPMVLISPILITLHFLYHLPPQRISQSTSLTRTQGRPLTHNLHLQLQFLCLLLLQFLKHLATSSRHLTIKDQRKDHWSNLTSQRMLLCWMEWSLL